MPAWRLAPSKAAALRSWLNGSPARAGASHPFARVMLYDGRDNRGRSAVPGRRLGAVAWLATLTLLAACSQQVVVTYVPEGGAYGADDVAALLESADLGPAVNLTTEEAPAARQEALASLRLHGADAAALADSLTSEFPPDVAAVPVIVEHGTYEGTPAWIVIEAWGDAGGKLVNRRIWVFSYGTREVITAQSAP